MSDYPRIARPDQVGREWERLERDFQRELARIPKPVDPSESERVHIETWKNRPIRQDDEE